MSRLNDVLNANGKSKAEKKNYTVPTYGTTGKIEKVEISRVKKVGLIIGIVLAVLALIIYLPQLFIKDEAKEAKYTKIEMDSTKIKVIEDAISKAPSGDFDGDGIDNSREITEGTSPWNIDSDGDHLSDYYEIYISKTDPTKYDDGYMEKKQKEADEAEGKGAETPYRMENVILWANDYSSKAYGGIIKTTSGYHFNNFSGYAQFPESEDGYVYSVNNGVHKLLPHREEENAWKISGDTNIEIYPEELPMTNELKLFGANFYLRRNPVSNFFESILPNKGLVISMQKKAEIDVDPDVSEDMTTDIQPAVYDEENQGRFTVNSNTMANLQYVREAISTGKCVIVSLYNDKDGEIIGIIYGYSHKGELLVADSKTLQPAGTIDITEYGYKLLDKDETIGYYTYFDWSGFGMGSEQGDRISFFALTNGSNGNMGGGEDQIDLDELTEEETEEETAEETTEEITTEEETEATSEEVEITVEDDSMSEEPSEETTEEITTEVETTTEVTTEEVTTEAPPSEESTTEAVTEAPTTETTTAAQPTTSSSKKKSTTKRTTKSTTKKKKKASEWKEVPDEWKTTK